MRAFAQTDRFLSDVEARKLRPAYVFVGDETFFRRRCREAILQHLVPPDADTLIDGALPGVLHSGGEGAFRPWVE